MLGERVSVTASVTVVCVWREAEEREARLSPRTQQLWKDTSLHAGIASSSLHSWPCAFTPTAVDLWTVSRDPGVNKGEQGRIHIY